MRIQRLALVAVALVALAGATLHAQVTFQRLVHAAAEPQNWLTYSGNLLQPALQPRSTRLLPAT